MPWKETCAMEERRAFIEAWLKKKHDISTLCRMAGISRKTGYKWWRRFKKQGESGLYTLSRAPKKSVHPVDEKALEAIIALRRAHPKWGPRKLLVVTQRRHPELMLPSHSSVSRALRARGLSAPRKRRPYTANGLVSPYQDAFGPNASWSADFKGELRLSPSVWCYPLTIADVTSRYLLRCQGLTGTDGRGVFRIFDQAFCEYGLPRAIRTDNGPPFASVAPGGLSALSIWWICLGIVPHRIDPGRPTQNGRHERIHRTLLDECERANTMAKQQLCFDRFRKLYNEQRPHQALGDDVPNSRYVASPRRYPCRLRDPDYPDDYTVERLGTKGELWVQGQWVVLTPLLANLCVGLNRIGQQSHVVYFGPVPLGIVDAKGFHLLRKKRRKKRNQVLPMS